MSEYRDRIDRAETWFKYTDRLFLIFCGLGLLFVVWMVVR